MTNKEKNSFSNDNENQGVDILGLLPLIWEKRRDMLFFLVGFITLAFFHKTFLPLYIAQSSVYMNPEAPSSNIDLNIGLLSNPMGLKKESKLIQKYTVYFNSFQFHQEIIKSIDDQSSNESLNQFFNKTENTISAKSEKLKQHTSFSLDEQNTLNIKVKHSSADIASDIANIIANKTVAIVQNRETNRLKKIKEHLHIRSEKSNKEIQNIHKNLISLSERLSEGPSGTGSPELLSSEISFLRKTIVDAEIEIDNNSVIMETLKQQFSSENHHSHIPYEHQSRQEIQQRILLLESKNSILKKKVNSLSGNLKILTAQLSEEKVNANSIGVSINTFTNQLQLEATYLMNLRNQINSLEHEVISFSEVASILDYSRPSNTFARFPPHLTFPLALLLSLITFAFYICIKEEYFPKIRNLEMLSKFGFKNAGSIPALGQQKKHRHEIEKWISDMAFKHLRTSLINSKTNKTDSLVISVSSAMPGEGKSYISYNLAKAFYEMGKTTLLIDGDSQKEGLKEIYNQNQNPSLCLAGLLRDFSIEKINFSIKKGNPLAPFDFIGNKKGMKDFTELVSSKNFSDLIKTLRNRYEIIIIDTPPILPVVDGIVFSQNSDLTVFVSSENISMKTHVEQALKIMNEFIDSNKILLTLNRSSEKRGYYSYTHTNVSTVDFSNESKRKIS